MWVWCKFVVGWRAERRTWKDGRVGREPFVSFASAFLFCFVVYLRPIFLALAFLSSRVGIVLLLIRAVSFLSDA